MKQNLTVHHEMASNFCFSCLSVLHVRILGLSKPICHCFFLLFLIWSLRSNNFLKYERPKWSTTFACHWKWKDYSEQSLIFPKCLEDTLCCRHNYASAKRSIKKALCWKKSLITALKWQVDLYELNVSLHSKYQTKKGAVSDKRPPPHKNKIKQTSKTD